MLKYENKKEEKVKKYVSRIATKTQKFNISLHTGIFFCKDYVQMLICDVMKLKFPHLYNVHVRVSVGFIEEILLVASTTTAISSAATT
jgi:hypothetical protein